MGLPIFKPENINGFVEDIGDWTLSAEAPLEALATDFYAILGLEYG